MRYINTILVFLIIGCNNVPTKTQVSNEYQIVGFVTKLDSAKILFQKRNFERALVVINSFLESSPQSDSAYFYMALIIQKQKPEDGGKGTAIEALDKAIKLNPKFKEAYYYRAIFEFYYNVLDNGFKNIWNDINKAIEIDSNYIDALLFRASHRLEALRHQKKDSLCCESIKDTNRILELNPNLCEAYIIRGDMKHELGDNTGACNDWEKARSMGCEVTYFIGRVCK